MHVRAWLCLRGYIIEINNNMYIYSTQKDKNLTPDASIDPVYRPESERSRWVLLYCSYIYHSYVNDYNIRSNTVRIVWSFTRRWKNLFSGFLINTRIGFFLFKKKKNRPTLCQDSTG